MNQDVPIEKENPLSGGAERARRVTEAALETHGGGNRRWSAKRTMSVVLELRRGADPESTNRKYGVTAATLSEWQEALMAAGEEGLKIRQEGLVDEQGRRMKSGIAEPAMENELLRERIRRMEDEKPFLRCGSRAMGRARSASTGPLLRAGSGSEGVGPPAVNLL